MLMFIILLVSFNACSAFRHPKNPTANLLLERTAALISSEKLVKAPDFARKCYSQHH